MPLKTLLLILLVVLSLASCRYAVPQLKGDYVKADEFVGCIRINRDFYIDQCEVTVFNWREYMYWTSRVYGPGSPEYKATFPSAEVMKSVYAVDDFESAAFNEFQNFPVVGISREQAEAFSKWRSDRVFEYILIQNGKLTWNIHQDAETCFSVERYFAGEYENTFPDSAFLYYPEFSLPTPEQFEQAVHYSDSVNCRYFGDCWWSCFYMRRPFKKMQRDPEGCTHNYPIRPADPGTNKKEKKILHYLYSNVSEWSSVPGMAFSAERCDWGETVVVLGPFAADSASTTVGFRNVCTWKKWEKIDVPAILHQRIEAY